MQSHTMIDLHTFKDIKEKENLRTLSLAVKALHIYNQIFTDNHTFSY